MTNEPETEELQHAVDAVRAGDLAVLERILEAAPAVLGARDGEGRTLLLLACHAATGELALPPVRDRHDQVRAVELLVSAGADPSLADSGGWSPLHVAAMVGHVPLARLLVEAGAPLVGRLLGAEGGSPLSLALFYGQREVAEVLASPPVPDNLRAAAALGRDLERFLQGDRLVPQAREGLDFYRPLDLFPPWERTLERQEVLDEALTWAARNGRVGSMQRLVELGADVNACPYRGTPLTWSMYRDEVPAARWLLAHGADPDLRHDFGGTEHGRGAVAMHLAAQYGNLDCLRLLLEHGARTDVRDRAFEGTPLDWARYGGAAGAVELLEALGENP